MKRLLCIAALLLAAVMAGGCTTPMVRSDVTVFQEWPAELHGSTFVFERTKEQDASLEYRNYENLVRNELVRLGFSEASPSQTPKLKVTLSYRVNGRDVRVIEPVAIDPWYGAPPPYHSPYYYGRRAFYWPYYYYDPFWYGPPTIEYRESNYEVFRRDLRIVMTRADNDQRVYEVTVSSEGQNPVLAQIMPYLVHSAFFNFPAKNGETRHVEIPMQEEAKPANTANTANTGNTANK